MLVGKHAVECASPAQIARSINALPEARWILASDSGQAGNPKSPESLNLFAGLLHDHGVHEDRLRRMMQTEPANLLGAHL